MRHSEYFLSLSFSISHFISLLLLLFFSFVSSSIGNCNALNCSFTSRILERVIAIVSLCQRCALFLLFYSMPLTTWYVYVGYTSAPDNNGNISNLFYCYYSIDLQFAYTFCPFFYSFSHSGWQLIFSLLHTWRKFSSSFFVQPQTKLLWPSEFDSAQFGLAHLI